MGFIQQGMQSHNMRAKDTNSVSSSVFEGEPIFQIGIYQTFIRSSDCLLVLMPFLRIRLTKLIRNADV